MNIIDEVDVTARAYEDCASSLRRAARAIGGNRPAKSHRLLSEADHYADRAAIMRGIMMERSE